MRSPNHGGHDVRYSFAEADIHAGFVSIEPSMGIETSQPWLDPADKAHPNPSEDQIAEYMKVLGFRACSALS